VGHVADGCAFLAALTPWMPRQRASSVPGVLAADRQLSPSTAAERVRSFLRANVGSSLLAWRRHLDTDDDGRIGKREFVWRLTKLGCQDDVSALFKAIDADKSNEVSLEEIDSAEAALWQHFVSWSTQTFTGAIDMMAKVSGSRSAEELSEHMFCTSIQRMGWLGEHEQLLFSVLDLKGQGKIALADLEWVDAERRRRIRKLEAKRRAYSENTWRDRQKHKAKSLTSKFRVHLLRRHGSYLRAWRNALSPNDAVTLNKNQFMKACAKMGCQANSTLIWQTLDVDSTATISLDKLDLRSAELLANFHKFIMDRFGSAIAAFGAIDRANTKQVRVTEFEKVLQQLGFSRSQREIRELFAGLDKDDNKSITVHDMVFLDKWRVQPVLLASPNPIAMNEVKKLLLDKCGSYLKAWRQILDKDSSNRCSLTEFVGACQRLRYSGDILGAWRALDADLSGYITLAEIDLADHKYLLSFKQWADEEFGSTTNVFDLIEKDDEGIVTEDEFRHFLYRNGYSNSPGALFRALDCNRGGTLSLDEVAFLDDWEPENDDNVAHRTGPIQPQQSEIEPQQPQQPRQQQQHVQLGWHKQVLHRHNRLRQRRRLHRDSSQDIFHKTSSSHTRSSLRSLEEVDSCPLPASLHLLERPRLETSKLPSRHEAASANLMARPFPNAADYLQPLQTSLALTSSLPKQPSLAWVSETGDRFGLEEITAAALASSAERARSAGSACLGSPYAVTPSPRSARKGVAFSTSRQQRGDG